MKAEQFAPLSIFYTKGTATRVFTIINTMGKKKKILKGTLITLGIIIISLIALVAFSPLIIQTYVNSESGTKTINGIVSDYLDAEIDFNKINLKVWRNMPNIELELINSEIISKAIRNDLTDTLAKFDTLRLSVNVVEFLKNDSIIVNEVLLSNPTVKAYTNTSGKSNWEIYESDTTPDEDTSSFDYKIIVKELLIDNLKASYEDEASKMIAEIDSTSISLSGDITSSLLSITTELKAKAKYDDGSSQIEAKILPSTINLSGNLNENDYELATNFGQILADFSDSSSNTRIVVDSTNIFAHALISDSTYDLNTKISINLNEYGDSELTFKDIPLNLELKAKCNSDFNKFEIDTLNLTSNDLFIHAAGMAENMADSSWNTDLALTLDIPHINNVVDMIPESLTSELKKYKISGGINFNGRAKGTYKDDIYPNIDANLTLNDVRAFVVEKNAEVKVNLASDICYKSDKQSESYINISQLDASVGETYLELKGNAKNILADPYIDAKLKCNLNLDYISNLFPIEDITYKGQVSSDFEARFSLNNLMKFNLPKIYMLGNINIEKILLRIPSMKFFVFGKNATADVGINAMQSKRTGKTHLSNAKIALDTLRVSYPRTIDATISRLSLSANMEEPKNDVPQMRVSGNLKGIQAIVSDTLFVSGKAGRISMSVRQDTTDALIPALKATLNLDSITYYEPTMGAFLDSTRITLNGRPRVRKFKRVDGKRVEIDQSTRTSINIDSLINLCTGVTDLETALKKFTFDGKIYAKTARYMSPYFDLRTSARKLDITFTDDTLYLNNFMMRVGKSGLRLNGQVENMRRAFLRGRTLSANLSISSRNLDLNEILYANYAGEQAKIKDDEAKKAALSKIEKMKKGNPPMQNINVNDSVKAHYVDSLRRTYNKRDLSEIYKERMGKMKSFVEKAYSEELANSDNDTEENDTASEIDYDTVPMSLITIPENLNCKVNLKLDTIRFAGLKMNEFTSDITIQNSTVSIKDLRTTSNVGDLKLNATYHCDTTEIAQAGIDLIGTDVTVEDLLNAIPMIDSILPMLSSFEGKLDCELSALTDLDKEMNPILPSLQTACHIKGKNLVLLDGETFITIAKYLMFKKKTKNVIDNMSVEFTIDKNILSVYPFSLSMDKYKVAVSGKMNFDFKYFFHISVLEPKGLPIPLGINVQSKTPKEKKKDKKSKDEEQEEEGELVDETDDFEFRIVKPLYKDEKAIAQTINLANKTGLGRISMQQTLRTTIQGIIENYDKNAKKE